MIVTCVTKHAFQGNPSELQVSFPAGERVTYDTMDVNPQGWVWVLPASSGSSGWCPQTYLMPPDNSPMAPTPAAPAPIAATPKVNDQKWIKDADDDIFGTIMGGSTSRPREAPFAMATPVAPTDGGSAPANRARGTFQNLGTGMQQAGRKSWMAVSNGAQVAGKAISNGAQVAGTHAQKTFADARQQNQTISNKPECRRSAGEQRAADVGNYAARGAVAEGMYRGIVSGGNPKAAIRGATRGAVWGASIGTVRRWKPFG